MTEQAQIKLQLGSHLKGGEAFIPLDELLKKIPFDNLEIRPKGLPYSFYELFYHIRFTQKDILDYCTAKEYKEHTWPEGYWPLENLLSNEADWEKLKEDYFKERELLITHLRDPETNLLAPLKNTSHTLLREVLLVIEHTAYHTGQMLIILRHLDLHK